MLQYSMTSLFSIFCQILMLCGIINYTRASQMYFYKVNKGGTLNKRDIISSLIVHTELECSNECLAKTGCSSFNYRSPLDAQNNCQLSNKSRDELTTIQHGEWIFYQNIPILKINKSEEKSNGLIHEAVGANCVDLYENGVRKDGVYDIDPDGLGSFPVYCEMTSGGWTVIQRRFDGSVDFFLGWSQYKTGFGDLIGEFWLGLDKIYRSTQSGLTVLRIDLMDFNDAQAYAQYNTFEISGESTRYTLNVGGFSGNAGDSLNYHNGHQFSTKDNDITTGKCANNRKGAWWYDACAWSNLNGQYLGPNQDQWHGIQWRYWKNTNECMKEADMKLRPRQ